MEPKNMLVYAATEAEFLEPERSRSAMKKIREAGFESVYLEFRNVKASKNGPRFLRAVGGLVQAAKEEGLYVAVEASFNNLDAELLEEAPEAFTDALHLHEILPSGGCFSIGLGGDPSTWEFPYAALATRREGVLEIQRRFTLGEPRIRLEGGGCAMTRHPGRTVAIHEWDIPVDAEDAMVLLVTRKRYEYSFKDIGHPALLERLPALLKCRLDTGADELYFDEPHFGFAFYENNGRAISDRLFRAFEESFGYRLEDVLPELWVDIGGSNSSLVRLHYSELLERSLAVMEDVIRDSVQRFTAGKAAVHLGGHRTMHEELSDDVLIGCSDYFRHDAATTASYTDSVFERPDAMAAMGQLARSMAALQPGRLAWNMSWGFRPTQSQQEFYAQLLGAMNVRWCLHAWNDTMMFGPGHPHHPCWETMARDLSLHRSHVSELEGWEPMANTLLVYNWRAAAVVSGAVRHVQRRALILWAWTLTKRSVPFLFSDGDRLAARLEAGDIETIVLHWPDALPAETWAALAEWVREGGRLIVTGPLPRIFSDGSPVDEKVYELCGIQPPSASTRMVIGDPVVWEEERFVIDPKTLSPHIDDAPVATWLDSWPMETLKPSVSSPLAMKGSDVVAVRSACGNGTVVTTPLEISFASGLVERALGLPAGGVDEVSFYYRQGDRRKSVSIPWCDHPA